MYCVVQDLIKFYESEIGGIVRKTLGESLTDICDDLYGLRVLGCGYPAPYLDVMCENVERSVIAMPAKQGAHNWPGSGLNQVTLCEEGRLPFETCSIDRAVLIHYLEYCDDQKSALEDVWRVLKPNGRLLLVVPNRMGAWAHADWSPFGHGQPFSVSQANVTLKAAGFIPESQKGAVFVPPLPDSPVMMRFSGVIEKMGQSVFPFVAGVHVIEASKKVYANAKPPSTGSAVLEKTKKLLGGKAVTAPQSFSSDNRKV